MAKALVGYDKDLPEIPGRLPWVEPTSYLVKDPEASIGWREDNSGRRPSKLLLVPKIREEVNKWRKSGYEGASKVTRRLFAYWFEEDHEVSGFDPPFRYYFCQREAIETLAWLVEIYKQRDVKALIETYGATFRTDLLPNNIEFKTAMDGKRQLHRYVPERNAEGAQELPPENLRRFAFKIATGAGKTWVMAMTVVWSRFHKQRVANSPLSTNFLIVAPNVIVYQRLQKDFENNQIFHELPLIPPEWKGAFSQKVILRGETAEPAPEGNVFLTNIHPLYESRDEKGMPATPIEALLGEKPKQDLAAADQRSMLERVKSLKDLIVLNDEAHHVHDEDLKWSQSLLSIDEALPNGLGAWLDFSATPKDQSGLYFPWTVCDYPLAQAVEDRIIKAPIIVTNEDDSKQPTEEPGGVTKNNVVEKYGYWLQAAVERWKAHQKVYKKLGIRPVLFIMAEKNDYADAIGKHLWQTKGLGFKKSEVLVIHTDKDTGEVRKGDLEKARLAARNIDEPENKIKAVVSVMMLREGWDVRNVTVVLGLRPFTAQAEILPEQVIGRGLRLMAQVSPDKTQTLEVLGTRKLLELLRNQLESEGVGVVSTGEPPLNPVTIEPLEERLQYDIAIPLTKPAWTHSFRNLSELDVGSLEPIQDREELPEPYRIRLKMEFASTETEVHQADIAMEAPSARNLLTSIANKVSAQAKLPSRFDEMYPVVRDYVQRVCFGKQIELEQEKPIRSHLMRLEVQEGIARYLALKISELTLERRPFEFKKANFHLSETKPFIWRRNLPALEASKTVFSFVATFNAYERAFAEFLEQADDVLRFAALGTTEQGDSSASFRVDYVKESGAIGFYYPDWVAVQKTENGEANWIIETKGRVWENTERKDVAMREWCQQVTSETRNSWRFIRVNQADFASGDFRTLKQLVVKIVSDAMFAERDRRATTMSREEVRQARDEGRL